MDKNVEPLIHVIPIQLKSDVLKPLSVQTVDTYSNYRTYLQGLILFRSLIKSESTSQYCLVLAQDSKQIFYTRSLHISSFFFSLCQSALRVAFDICRPMVYLQDFCKLHLIYTALLSPHQWWLVPYCCSGPLICYNLSFLLFLYTALFDASVIHQLIIFSFF